MKILDINENITRIISLVENAKEFIVFVSPYNYLVGWDELREAINGASAKGIEVSWYVREGEGSNGLDGLNVKIIEIPLLHVKMFFSESEVIISSFHLMNNPDINWAFAINNQEEYKDVINFFERFVKPLAKPFENKIS
jgi:hypothetical protein